MFGSKLTFLSPNLLMRSSLEEIVKEEEAEIREKATIRYFIMRLL